jgi:hypothetical protein
MNLVQRTAERLVFGLGTREKVLLERLLTFFPLRSEAGATLSRNGSEVLKDAAALLKEALNDQRVDLAEWIKRRVVEGQTLSRSDGGWKLALERPETEKLLQILNELRVSAWTNLGCPEELDDAQLASTPGKAPLYVIMALAGQFEMDLVQALLDDGEEGRRTGK